MRALINMMVRYTFTLILIIYSLAGLGQSKYYEGHFITYSNDTLQRKIKVFNNRRINKITFLDENEKRQRFTAKKVKEFSIYGFHTYVAIAPMSKFPNKRSFAKVIEEGQARLLLYEPTKKYYLTGRSDVHVEKVKKWGFRSQVSSFFSDYSDIKKYIKSRKLKYRDVRAVVQEYNRWYEHFFIPYLETVENEGEL